MKLYGIKWIDSTQRSGWEAIENRRERALICFSVGWLIAENKDSITLSPNVSEKNHPTALYQCCGVITIPKRAILTKTTISSFSCQELE